MTAQDVRSTARPDRETLVERMKRFRLSAPELQQDPYPLYGELRAHCPVARSDEDGGFWIFSTYEDVRFTHQHPEYFSTRHISIPKMEYPSGPEIPQHIDPPEHMKYRKPMLSMFSPAQTNAAEPFARATAIELIEPFAGNANVDFMREFAIPYPCIVFCHLMGLPTSDLGTFLAWKDEYLRADPRERAARIAEIYAGASSMFEQLWNERLESHDRPDDLITKLMTMRYGNERAVTKDEFVRAARFIFFAGLDTVTSQIALFMHHLGSRLELRDQLLAGPDRIPRAIEELMRYDTLVAVAREVMQPVTVHGQDLKPGEMVLTIINSANRDAKVFSDPEVIDFDRRAANIHLGFGIGPHRCLGSHLARMEMRVALEELHRRIPNYRVDPDRPARMHLGSVRGVLDLQLCID